MLVRARRHAICFRPTATKRGALGREARLMRECDPVWELRLHRESYSSMQTEAHETGIDHEGQGSLGPARARQGRMVFSMLMGAMLVPLLTLWGCSASPKAEFT